MSETTLHTDEFVLGTLGLVFSVGFLKANELFDFFDHTDVFRLENQILFIRGREFIALILFSAAYIVFLAVALIGVASIGKRNMAAGGATGGRRHALLVLSAVLIVLFIAHFFSFATSYAHAMHKYSEMFAHATARHWDFGI
jgi:hypothetical protein